jgi:hypothetical protein
MNKYTSNGGVNVSDIVSYLRLFRGFKTAFEVVQYWANGVDTFKGSRTRRKSIAQG